MMKRGETYLFFKMRTEVKAPSGSSRYEAPFAIKKECVNKLSDVLNALMSSRKPQSIKEAKIGP
jgi:hypothetical protein